MNRKQVNVVASSTFSFTVCFMVWIMFAVIGIPIKETLGLNETEFGLLIATPVLTGSLIRLPLGMWTDRFGGRIVFFWLMLACVIPIYMVGEATEYWQYLVLGLFIGASGGSFSVGIAYVARWFKREQQGTAMGVFGAGNAGAAFTKIIAPSIVAAYGWTMVPKVYAALMLGTALIFWFFSHSNPEHIVKNNSTIKEQLEVLKDPKIWRYCQYYSITFGGYVALALWMTKYYVNEYGLSLTTAGFLAACFSLPGGILRAVGGWLSDKYGAHSVTWWVMWVSWICLFIMSYPQTEFTVKTINGPETFHIGLNPWFFTFMIFIVGAAWGFGKASVFKYLADEYPDNIGTVSGVVGLAGGMGGFVLPIMFGVLLDITGIYSTAFMLLYGVVWVSLTWMYFSEIRGKKIMGDSTSPNS